MRSCYDCPSWLVTGDPEAIAEGEHALNTSWFEPDKDVVTSYKDLRRGVGVIGVALPSVLAIGGIVLFGTDLRASMSGYYYTGMRDVFVGSMFAIGFFLLSYKFGRLDNLLGHIAGICAVGLAVFPTAPEGESTALERTVGVLHLIFAGVLFLVLAGFSLFLFTRTTSEGNPTPQKKTRNLIYRICGYVILASLALAVLAGVVLGVEAKAELHPRFWLESVAVFAFGVSWLVKGETLFRDPLPQNT